MAARRKLNEPTGTPPAVSPQVGMELLRKQIEKGEKLLANRPLREIDHTTWQNTTREYLVKCFGSESSNVSRFLGFSRIFMSSPDMDETYWENFYFTSMTDQVTFLSSLVDILQTEIEIAPQTIAVPATLNKILSSKRIFVVHGHDDARREATARFLEKLKLQPVVLHEQPNEGRTIIEKVSDYSDVGFAVVLLTSDDRGGLVSEPYEKQQSRARQNVILELGYFLGKLGRNRVCALYEDGVEIPSDYKGVLFVKFDERGAWKFELAREMKAAGIEVDMNLAF